MYNFHKKSNGATFFFTLMRAAMEEYYLKDSDVTEKHA